MDDEEKLRRVQLLSSDPTCLTDLFDEAERGPIIDEPEEDETTDPSIPHACYELAKSSGISLQPCSTDLPPTPEDDDSHMLLGNTKRSRDIYAQHFIDTAVEPLRQEVIEDFIEGYLARCEMDSFRQVKYADTIMRQLDDAEVERPEDLVKLVRSYVD